MTSAHPTTSEGPGLEPFDFHRHDLPKPFRFGLPSAPAPGSPPRLKHWPEVADKAFENKTRDELITHSDGFAEASDDQILSHAHMGYFQRKTINRSR
jgi:hypothetical protein